MSSGSRPTDRANRRVVRSGIVRSCTRRSIGQSCSGDSGTVPPRRRIGLKGPTRLDGIHRILAYAIVALTVAGISWAVLLGFTKQSAGPAFERFQAAVVSAHVVGAASGLILLASGVRPAEGLHLLYAFVALALIPLARSFAGRPNGRGSVAFLVVAFAVLGALLYRLFTTG